MTKAHPAVFLQLVLLVAIFAGHQSPVCSQEPPPGFVRFNLEGEVPLGVLIDYVSERLDVQFVYSGDLAERTVQVRAPREFPVSSLMPLLASVLRMENLALVDSEVPGWKRIVDVKEIPQVARPGDAERVLANAGAATPVTQAFVLQHISVQQLANLIRPLVTQTSGTVIPITESNVLVVTDYAGTVLTVEKLIELVDRPPGQVLFEFYHVQNQDATTLAKQVKTMVASRVSGSPNASQFDLLPDKRSNQIAVVGPAHLVSEAMLLLKRLDVSLGLTTEVYRLENIKSERFDRIVKGFLATQDVERLYRSTIDAEGNLLIVRAPAEIHERIDELQEQLDVPVKADENPIQFYKLKNANAQEVLFTLLTLQEVISPTVGGDASLWGSGDSLLLPSAAPGRGRGALGESTLPGSMDRVPGLDGTRASTNRPLQLPLAPDSGTLGAYAQMQQTRTDRLSGVLGGPFGPGVAGFGGAGFGTAGVGGMGGVANLPGGARISADVATNSLIVYAPPDVQQMYQKLIDSLDRRRPQVLIEAEIVAVDTSDNARIGVEVSAGDRMGSRRLFEFTSFGLSEVDPTTGALAIRPALGFNGTLVDADVADVVVQALASHSRAQVLAAPRIVVNDNVEGELKSVVSVPFQSVNASQTVSTTSLGGNQEAGTTITVTPHINEDDNLLLEFAVEFSTFGETIDPNLPPPRQIDSVESVVTIPDGHTVIVGGLSRVSDTQTMTGIPFVEKIPVLRELSSLNTTTKSTTSFFLFIRPVILRDDLFSDMRLVSDEALRVTERPGQYPASQPLLIE